MIKVMYLRARNDDRPGETMERWSVSVGNGSVREIDILDTHALFGAVDAEFENTRSEFLHASIEPIDVKDIAEDHEL
jgi:hypothetical protein